MRKILFITVSLPIVLGIITGVILSGYNPFTKVNYKDVSGKNIVLAIGQEIGSQDKKSTRDNAIGLLLKSDDLSKGTHRLMRGADVLTIYLTSSTIDLNPFIGRGVQVWGETFQRKNIGWFMDIVKLKILK